MHQGQKLYEWLTKIPFLKKAVGAFMERIGETVCGGEGMLFLRQVLAGPPLVFVCVYI